MTELLGVIGDNGALATVLRFVVIMTVVVGGFRRTNNRVRGAGENAKLAAVRSLPTSNGYARRTEQQLGRMELAQATHSQDMRIRMSRMEHAFMEHQAEHVKQRQP